jgi:hypothetical protein
MILKAEIQSLEGKVLPIFSTVNGIIGLASLVLFFRSVYGLAATPALVAESILREVDGVEDVGRFAQNAELAAGAFENQARSDLMSGGLEGLLRPLGVSSEVVSGLGVGLGVLGILGDAQTIWNPHESGAGGWAARIAAGTNAVGTVAAESSVVGGVFATDAALGWVPGVGVGVVVASGLYLGGDYLYNNVAWFHNGANDVFSAVGTASDAVASGVATGAKDAVTGAVSGAEDVVGGIGNVASSVWHGL